MKKTVAKLKKDADKYWSKYIRYRDGELTERGWLSDCITCNQTFPIAQIQCGHFISRRVNALRFDEQNTNAQCLGCNMFKQGDQYTYSINLDLKYGKGTAKKLHNRRFETHKFTISELEEIINHAKEQIAMYEEMR